MPFVLADDVVDDLLAVVADQVVVLAALVQMYFGAVVALVAQLLRGEGRGQVATEDHPVQEF